MPRINKSTWVAVLGIGLALSQLAGTAEAKGPGKQNFRINQQSVSQGTTVQLQQVKKFSSAGIVNNSGVSALNGQLNAVVKKSNKAKFNAGNVQILPHNGQSNIGSAISKKKNNGTFNGVQLFSQNNTKNDKNFSQKMCKGKDCKKFNWFNNNCFWDSYWTCHPQHHCCWVDYCYVTPVVGYYNPYCYGYAYVDFSAPLVVNNVAGQESQLLQMAIEAFRRRDVKQALEYATAAVKENRNNGDAHQLRSLILFAMRDYEQSAAEANVALTGGPGWNSETLNSMYASADEYMAQLKMLEQYVNAQPTAAAPHFLLGYHYLMVGRIELAVPQLSAAVQLEPRDTVSAQLLKKLSAGLAANNVGPAVQQSAPVIKESAPLPQQPPTTGIQKSIEPAAAINAAPSQPSEAGPTVAKKVGTFTATPADGVTIKLTLNADGTFKWEESASGASQQFSGKYTLEKDVLTMTRSGDNDAMASQIIDDGQKGFTLRPKNADKDNPGMQFRA